MKYEEGRGATKGLPNYSSERNEKYIGLSVTAVVPVGFDAMKIAMDTLDDLRTRVRAELEK